MTNKTNYKKLTLLILVLFEISVFMTLIMDNKNYETAYSVDYFSGLNFRHVLLVFGILGMISFGYKKIKTNFQTIKPNH